MWYLMGSIVLTSYLTLSFKICEKYGVSVFQAIVFNYLICVITGSVVNGSFPVGSETLHTLWFRWACVMGVLFIAIFNIIGSLTMLVIDKRKDIAILTSLGANKQLIQGIFFIEGMMITITGCITGIVLGLGFCILQQRFGLVKMGSKMSMIDAYPVSLRLSDFVLVFFTVSFIAVIASGISARLSIKGLNDIKQDL